MAIHEVPPSIYIAIGAFIAALVAGLFSYLNMIASKENKVSEFRQEWITDLREQLAQFTASTQGLALIIEAYENLGGFNEDHSGFTNQERLSWINSINEVRAKGTTSLTKIKLMLNYKHLKENASIESDLMKEIERARDVVVSSSDGEEIIRMSDSIRIIAGPLLKMNWEIVKQGEPGYRTIKRFFSWVLAILFSLPVVAIGIVLFLLYQGYQFNPELQKPVNAENNKTVISLPSVGPDNKVKLSSAENNTPVKKE